jgi:hypothetical protein
VQHLLALRQPFFLFLIIWLSGIFWRHFALQDLLAKLFPKEDFPVARDPSQAIDSNP